MKSSEANKRKWDGGIKKCTVKLISPSSHISLCYLLLEACSLSYSEKCRRPRR